MSSVALYGGAESTEMSVQVPAPAGERWKVTVLTVPGAVSEAMALSATLGAAQVRAGGRDGDRAGRARPVDGRQDELGRLAAGVVGGADAEEPGSVGRDGPGDAVREGGVDAE